MAQAVKRLQKELKDFNDEEREGFSAAPIDDSDFFNWEADVVGPEDSPYEGGIFGLKIEYSKDHPFRPPKLFTTTKIFHPNLNYESGRVCCCALDFLKDCWSPDYTIIKILESFQNLLLNPNLEKVCGLGNEYAGKLYKEDKDEFDRIAKEWTIKYAT